MRNTYSICTRHGERVTDRATKEEINRLRGLTDEGRLPFRDLQGRPELGQKLIYPHPRKNRVWLVAAGVDLSVIRAELRRKITNRVPIAMANATVREIYFSNDLGAGHYYEHFDERCKAYLWPTAA